MGTTLTHIWHQLLAYDPAQPLLFNSGLFWVLFLLFLPAYALLQGRRTQMMLFVTAFSLYFFYKSSGWHLVLMLMTGALDFLLARCIHNSRNSAHRRVLLVLSIVCSAGVLVAFKYSNFLLWNFDALVGRNFQPLDIVLPVGISFYTFRTISYVVDVYRRQLRPTDSLLEYLFFISFFPCLLAGPIARAADLLPQIRQPKPATHGMIYGGLWLVLLGVVKKAVAADYIAQYVDLAFGNPAAYSGLELLMAIWGYTMQIYLDFSGYSDMAIGIALVMGFRLKPNFDFPYRATNVTEFWHHWHISLSTWLRDYIYIPLGGNRKGTLRQYANLMITMLVGGLWHGAAWKFVLWGAAHGGALVVHKALSPILRRLPDCAFVRLAAWLATITLVALLWVPFRADSVAQAVMIVCRAIADFDLAYLPVFVQARNTWCIVIVLATALHLLPHPFWTAARRGFIRAHWLVKLVLLVIAVQLVIQTASADVQPFIYAQF